MKLESLWQLQSTLDERIHETHHETYETTERKRLLAFAVELSELANETRCFKYWSTKPASATGVILDEYVDGLHFILSYGIGLGYASQLGEIEIIPTPIGLVDQFLALYDWIHLIHLAMPLNKYRQWLESYLQLGVNLGFTEIQIETAYFEKNKVNHQRQDNHY